ncbi:MAG: hypothetical protein C5B51_23040 [Terriglobia bacterium]|nr:MAG: hypothetical protein C5B51_23040 [Terriglobia bacterium]
MENSGPLSKESAAPLSRSLVSLPAPKAKASPITILREPKLLVSINIYGQMAKLAQVGVPIQNGSLKTASSIESRSPPVNQNPIYWKPGLLPMKTDRPTTEPECNEDPGAFQRFDAIVRKVLSVSHDEIMRREAEYKRQSSLNPHKRGPKPKSKRSA